MMAMTMPASTDARMPLVHGMAGELVASDWPPLSQVEVADVLSGFGMQATSVLWQSPRPMSSAVIAGTTEGPVFVKRHHRRVRAVEDLEVEHLFARHLVENGVRVPVVRATALGTTVLERGEFCFEVHELFDGLDRYREAMSWTSYHSPAEARAAGAALAKFHLGAAGFEQRERPPGVLVNSIAVIGADDPLGALRELLDSRPGLRRAAGGRDLLGDFAEVHLEKVKLAAEALRKLPRQWAHGDWHGSNLAWQRSGDVYEVSGVFDLGLSNRTSAMHDLAIAIERSMIDWLGLRNGPARYGAEREQVQALLDGYRSVRALSRLEARALATLLPVAHLEYALSELEYFGDVIGSSENCELAYEGFFLGHARFFDGPQGTALIEALSRS